MIFDRKHNNRFHNDNDLMNDEIRILIINDNTSSIKSLRSLLIDQGYLVEIASNIQEIEKKVSSSVFQFLLIDSHIPNVDTYSIAGDIIRKDEYQYSPIIFTSPSVDLIDRSKVFKLGLADYIVLPFDNNEILTRINNLLSLSNQMKWAIDNNTILEAKVEERTQKIKAIMLDLEQAKSSLSSLDKAKTSFLDMISHEIRTPLNGIMGASSLIDDLEIENQNLKTYLRILNSSVSRLEEFSLTALMVTQLQSCDFQITKDTRSINGLLDSVVVKLDPYLQLKNIKIVKGDKCENCNLQVNEEYFQRALYHVIHNAIKYSPENSNIEIETTTIHSDFRIRIKDYGSGIDEQLIKNLFIPFGTIQSQHEDKNMGLGLVATHFIMKAHNGSVNLYNHQDGCIAELILPK